MIRNTRLFPKHLIPGLLYFLFVLGMQTAFSSALDQAAVHVNFTLDLGEFRHLWIGSDLTYIDATVTPTMTEAMNQAWKAGFRYMRFHDPIVDAGVYSEDEDGNPQYNWTNFDRYINAIVSRGYWPVVVLETMPPEIAGYDGGQGYTNPYPPKDPDGYPKWQNLVYELVKHCKDTWGGQIRNWYFEVWNEPDASGYFKGTLEDYLKIYDYAVAGAVAAEPNIRIGGPGGAGTSWVIPLLEHCASGQNYVTGATGTRIDFISWHIYTVGVGLPKFDVLEERLRTVDRVRAEYPQYKDLPILITEWGCSASEHPVHDQPYDAAFRTMAVHKFLDRGITLALPYSLAEGPYEAHEGFRGALGLFTKTTIPKPSFRAFELLNRMVGRRVECSGSGPVGGMAVLAFNKKKAWIMLYNLIEDYRQIYQTSVQLSLAGLPPGSWSGKIITIEPGVCDPKEAWLQMGSPKQLSQDQYQSLLAASQLPPARSLVLEGNEVSLEMAGSSILFLELELTEPTQSLKLEASLNPTVFSPRRGQRTGVNISSSQSAKVSVSVYKLNGELVKVLLSRKDLSGQVSQLSWDGKDEAGKVVPNGLYIILVEAQTQTEKNRKLMKVQVKN